MRRDEQRVKRHVISMRVSAEEFDSMHETMKSLHYRRVSDLMRDAFKLLMTPPGLEGAIEGAEEAG
ncbi:hypothetical protein [Geomonas sp.]|uniref:hypothetical protein n=1 Tax=Geomonas sp. TaxID=2651584 RepID=UPI002B4A1017|nr:hypothetical protein [Geomonas sp.]HJV36473.1 hypothetical protein [Geomonas sp.]